MVARFENLSTDSATTTWKPRGPETAEAISYRDLTIRIVINNTQKCARYQIQVGCNASSFFLSQNHRFVCHSQWIMDNPHASNPGDGSGGPDFKNESDASAPELREDQVQNAVSFLSHPKVRSFRRNMPRTAC